jgi:thioredoxin-like negative regulator of GroEL
LTPNNFPACLDSDDGKAGWFIAFYGKWCQHSQALSFIWNDFNTLYGDRVNVAKFDCDAEGHWPICDSFDVEALPTMIWFPSEARNEERSWWQYKGDRNV